MKGLQVAIGGGQWIEPVVGEHNGLGIFELREHFGLKRWNQVRTVAFARTQACPMRSRSPGEYADPSVLSAFAQAIGWFEHFFLATEATGRFGAEVVT